MTSKALIWSILQIDSARAYNSFYITSRKSPGWEEKSPTDGLKPMI